MVLIVSYLHLQATTGVRIPQQVASGCWIEVSGFSSQPIYCVPETGNLDDMAGPKAPVSEYTNMGSRWTGWAVRAGVKFHNSALARLSHGLSIGIGSLGELAVKY